MNAYINEYNNEPIVANKIYNENNKFKTNILNEDFKIFHMNIRSVQKNVDDFYVLINNISVNFDVIILTETYQLHDPFLFKLQGYNTVYNYETLNQNDGILAFISDKIDYTSKTVNIGEIKALKILITLANNKKIDITSIYRSPSNCPKLFNSNLTEYLYNCEKYDINVITGDINIDLMADNDYVEEYKNIMSYFGFTSYINEYTRLPSYTCIDHLFVSNKNNLNMMKYKSYIFRYNITDHCPIALTFRIEKKLKEKSNYKSYINYTTLKMDLKTEQWKNIYQENNVNEITDNFINTLKYYINKHTKQVKINNTKRRIQKWMTTALLKAITKKNNMYKAIMKYPEKLELKDKYKTYKNCLNKLVTKAKKDYFQKQIEKNKNSSKSLWECINNICGQPKPKTKIDNIILQNGTIISDKKDIANSFNKYFKEVGENFARNIPDIKYSDRTQSLRNSIYLQLTNENEVIRIIENLKCRKSPGVDGIRSETLKEIKLEIIKPLTYLINQCLQTGYFPQVLKTSIIKPLYKTGSKVSMENYRPVSLLSNISKIIEKIIKYRLSNFLAKYDILSHHQYGFREGRSTEDAILKLTSYIYDSLDKKIPTISIFLDLSKAFDTICHKKLLDKLYMYGIRGTAYNLFQTYLSNRRQYVQINDIISRPEIITFGVPQGTVLGPVLFTLYINSMLSLNTIGKIISFADDTAILYSSPTWQSLKENIENDFPKISEWLQYNKLSLNYEKTKYLPFCSYTNGLPNIGPLNVGLNSQILESDNTKYLGIIIDRHMRWDIHIKQLVKKIRGHIPKFKYLRDFLKTNYLKTIYYSQIESLLSYGILGWGGVNECYLNNVHIIQKWVLKIIFHKTKYYPSDILYKETQIKDVRQVFCQKILLAIFHKKIKLESREPTYNTRSDNTYVFPRSEKTVGQRSALYLAPRIFVLLPTYIRNIKSYKTYKKEIKKWIMQEEIIMFSRILNQN